MGFFTHEAARMIEGRAQYITDTFESVCEDVSIEPCSEDLIEAGFDGIIAMNENYNSIMRRMAYAEASALEETGQEFVYTEGVIGDLYNTIKSFLMKVWERIKSLFKRFIMVIDSYAKDDKAFAKKYQKEIFGKSGDMSDFSFKGYKWNIDNSGYAAAMGECDTESANAFVSGKGGNRDTVDTDTVANNRYETKADYESKVDKDSDEMEKIRAGIFKKFTGTGSNQNASPMTSEEFRKEVHELFRSGETEKEELDGKDIDVHDMYNKLIQSNQDRKTAKNAFDGAKKAIDKDIKTLERLHNDNIKDAPNTPSDDEIDTVWNDKTTGKAKEWIDDNHPKTSYNNNDEEWKAAFKKWYVSHKQDKNDLRSKNLAYFARKSRVCKECLLTINSELLNAVKERSRQYKACLIAYVHYRPSGESAMHESYLIGKEKNVGGNIFGGISFV